MIVAQTGAVAGRAAGKRPGRSDARLARRRRWAELVSAEATDQRGGLDLLGAPGARLRVVGRASGDGWCDLGRSRRRRLRQRRRRSRWPVLVDDHEFPCGLRRSHVQENYDPDEDDNGENGQHPGPCAPGSGDIGLRDGEPMVVREFLCFPFGLGRRPFVVASMAYGACRAGGGWPREPGQLVVPRMRRRQEAGISFRVGPCTTLPLVTSVMRQEPDAAISLRVGCRTT